MPRHKDAPRIWEFLGLDLISLSVVAREILECIARSKKQHSRHRDLFVPWNEEIGRWIKKIQNLWSEP